MHAKTSNFKVRAWKEEDIPGIIKCQKSAYFDFISDDLCTERHYRMQLMAFPKGQFLVECEGEIVAYATSLIIQLDEDVHLYSYAEITGVGTFSTHNPLGDTLYGADIAVRSDYLRRGLAGRLYIKRKAILKKFNLRRMVAGGRIPGYSDYEGILTPQEYVDKVSRRELDDPALRAHLKAGYKVTGIHMEYFSDKASLNYATALEMLNPSFDPSKRLISTSPLSRITRKVRVCATQFEMQRIKGWGEFAEHVKFFIETASEYNSHFLVFPELFTAELFSVMDKNQDTYGSIVQLSNFTERYIELLTTAAKSHNLYIIGGSHPIVEGENTYNRAHLFTPAGNVYTQDKLHVTPGERRQWNITPGKSIRVFDTGIARIAIPVCYDIEFPELSRLLAMSGAEIFFVPFSTDELNSYYRVRYCAQARATENSVYVVLSGNIGNLYGVKSFLLNYGQAVICTPCDVTFPKKGIAAEADPNSETVVIYDLDLSALSLQRALGSVLPLQDRRTDLYQCTAKVPVEVISAD